jgi:hypothetical protein
MKYVQITRELFFKLLSYLLLDKFEEKEEIEKGLEAKLNTMVNHDIYSKSKTAPTLSERFFHPRPSSQIPISVPATP